MAEKKGATQLNDGWVPVQKGWASKGPSDKPTIGSGGDKPPSGGSAIKQASPPQKR
jgi:hypothetical protein